MSIGPRRLTLVVVCLLGGALALRLAAAGVVQRSLPAGQLCLIAGDADGYWQLARRIARGEDYAIYEPKRWVLRMPGFPLVLAASMRLNGESPFETRMVLAVVGTLACGLVGWLAWQLFDPPTALVAMLLTALSPTMILFSVLLLSETLFAATLVASLIGIARLLRAVRNSVTSTDWFSVCREGLIAGLLIGLATLVRPTWILIGPLAAVAVGCVGRGRAAPLASAAFVLAGVAICLAPWTIRNWHVTGGHFVPTTLWVGASLYDGLNPAADGGSNMEFVERDGLYRRMSEYDADAHYRRAAWDFALANWGRSVELGLIKLGRYFNPSPNAAQFQHPLAASAAVVLFLATMVPAAIAVWNRRRQFWVWALPILPLLYFAAIHTVFVGSLRYRLPAEYPLLILTAAGLLDLLRRWKPGMFSSPSPAT